MYSKFSSSLVCQTEHEKQTKTLDKLADSEVSGSLHPRVQMAVDATGYEDHKKT